MKKLAAVMFLSVSVFSISAGAQQSDYSGALNMQDQLSKDIQKNSDLLKENKKKITELGSKRVDALRLENSSEAERLKTEMEALRSSNKNANQSLAKAKQEVEAISARCDKDPQCVEQRKRKELEAKLVKAKEKLKNDDPAAKMAADKAEIEKIEAELNGK